MDAVIEEGYSERPYPGIFYINSNYLVPRTRTNTTASDDTMPPFPTTKMIMTIVDEELSIQEFDTKVNPGAPAAPERSWLATASHVVGRQPKGDSIAAQMALRVRSRCLTSYSDGLDPLNAISNHANIEYRTTATC